MEKDIWLIASEFAKRLGIKRDIVYRWIRELRMPCHKIGRRWRLNQREAEVWVLRRYLQDMTGE